LAVRAVRPADRFRFSLTARKTERVRVAFDGDQRPGAFDGLQVMLRTAVELIVGLLVAYFIRSVLAIIMKAASPFGQSQQTSSGRPGTPRRPSDTPQASELKKDPVCGTFVSTATAVQKSVSGQTYYFCSTDCRDKFRG